MLRNPLPLLLVLVGLAAAAAVAPAPQPAKAAKANATAQLEALVADMADAQQKGTASAPEPKPLGDDAAHGRRLGRCNCGGGYRNGASALVPVCSKREATNNVCYPQKHGGTCELGEVRCGGSRPAPSPLASAEEVELINT